MNVPSGYTALDLIGFTDKGVYNSATAYVRNDIVHYNGNLWRCLVDDTTAVTPAEGASWTVFLAEPTSAAEDIIAPVEASTTSTRQYAVGKQLILNDTLYTVTSAINIGDTLAVGTNISASDTLVEQLGTKANASSLATVATSGSYNDLSNTPSLATVATSGDYDDLTDKPTLGTAAAKDVPASGNASTTEVVMGDDTRLTDSRNAADVYSWAKASTKPTYNGSEINTSAAQTGTAQSSVASTIASGTSMDAAIGDLLNNDVTINTDLGNVKQALSNEVATRAAVGAHNLLCLDDSTFKYASSNTSYTKIATGVEIANTTSQTFSSITWTLTYLKPNTDYVLSCDVTKISGAGRIIIQGNDSSTRILDQNNLTTGSHVSASFNTGTIANLCIIIYSTSDTAATGDVKYENLMIRLATDTDPTYQPYAMTNKELTEAVKCLVLSTGSTTVNALPYTFTNANIENDMVCINSVLSNPAAQTGDWTVTTSSGTAQITGTISGATTITLYLIKSR